MPDKIMLIDGNSIINRAFYALPVLTNKDGEFTNAVYGFLNIFFKFLEEENPKYVSVAFDVSKQTFRHKVFKEYKGTRKKTPDELRLQIPLLKNLLNKMNIKVFEKEGLEADDILGTLATISSNEGLAVTIISGDRDLLQLCSSSIKVRIPKTKAGKTEVEDYFEKDVKEKIGVTPTEFIDVKALMGDASDNIPGVPSIGEKTAIKIIQEFKSIENAIENIEKIKPKKASENLLEYKDTAVLSKFLATIVIDADIAFEKDSCILNNIYNENSLEEIKRLDFKTLIPKFSSSKKIEVNTENFKIIKTLEEVKAFSKELSEKSKVAFSIVRVHSEIAGISFSFDEDYCYFVMINEALKEDELVKGFKDFFENKVQKLSLDTKKEAVYLNKFGIKLNNIIFDTYLAAYILDTLKGSYSFNEISEDFLLESCHSEDEFLGKGRNKIKLKDINQEVLVEYACSQSRVCFKSHKIMKDKLEENNQTYLYYEIELPLATVLKDMELYGIKINKEELEKYDKKLEKSLNLLTKEIYSEVDGEFNINSPQQLGIILFEKLGLKSSKKTKTGYSTAAEVLEKLKTEHPIVEKVLNYRTLTKLKSTYAEGLLAVTNKETGKIHSTFNQTITATGRISSTEPNLQNIPIRLELGRELRKIFIPSSDEFIFLDGDYSQIELRVLAHISEDDTLINAFIEGQDIHRLTASQVLKIPYTEVSSKDRNNAKAVNFGIVYGISAFSLSQDLNISKKEAENYIKGYFEKYPKVKEYMNLTIENAEKDGYVKTIFGRRRNLPELKSSNYNLRSFGERVAMNMPIQGTAADIIKIAMVKTYNALKEKNLKSRLILQVHDELLIEVHKDEKELVKDLLKNEMENCVKLAVPLETDFNFGETWYDAK